MVVDPAAQCLVGGPVVAVGGGLFGWPVSGIDRGIGLAACKRASAAIGETERLYQPVKSMAGCLGERYRDCAEPSSLMSAAAIRLRRAGSTSRISRPACSLLAIAQLAQALLGAAVMSALTSVSRSR